jgi:hypothetical protein
MPIYIQIDVKRLKSASANIVSSQSNKYAIPSVVSGYEWALQDTEVGVPVERNLTAGTVDAMFGVSGDRLRAAGVLLYERFKR